ncbi:MAG: hypothetical protein ACI9SE_000113 [Neolewinella sp.]
MVERRMHLLGPLDNEIHGVDRDLNLDLDWRVRIEREHHFAKTLGARIDRGFVVDRWWRDESPARPCYRSLRG